MAFLNKDQLRMIQWFLFSIICYAVAAVLANLQGETDAGLFPRIQTVLWKCGHLNLAAFIGYRIDRSAFSRVGKFTEPMHQLRRAIVISAAMMAFGMAL
jgi:hypothetical protein